MVRIRSSLLCAFLLCSALAASARDSAPQWNHVNGVHFSLLTDAPEKTRIDAELPFEQMRAVIGQLLLKSKLRLSQPLEIIGFANHEEYAQIVPTKGGQPLAAAGFFLAGADRNYIILDLSAEESWRSVSYPLAKLFLSYNYPPTQPWFDEGFAQYFASLRLDTKPAQVGGDPAAFTALLSTQPWIPIAELFSLQAGAAGENNRRNLFSAESWIVMHYLLSQGKLPEAGTYFGLVENQKIAVEQAIQQGFGMNAAQFEQTVQDYFHSIAPVLAAGDSRKVPGSAPAASAIQLLPTLVAAGDVGASVLRAPDGEARALVAEASLRVPEHRETAVHELETLCDNPSTESAIAHRALGWEHLQKKEYDQAAEELAKASGLDAHDTWVRYYLGLVKYRRANSGMLALQGLPNMMQDLRAVIDANPEFAEAYNMLAVAQLQGGGTNAALTSIRSAIELNPRDQGYLLNLAHIDLAGKRWDAGTALLERLQDSSDSQVASAARKDLSDLPTLKKYGILPQSAAESNSSPAAVSSASEDSESAEPASAEPTEAPPDMRKPQSLKGKLLSVDCSQAPVAIVRVAAGTRMLKLRTEDYKSLLLIGADSFSCEWRNIPVMVNYKAGGKVDGDLVSLEAQ